MAKFFTHYWMNDTWESHRRLYQNQHLVHAASNVFRKRGVSPGDFVYIITVSKGELFVGGRMKVVQILGQKESEDFLQEKTLWIAEDHCVSTDDNSTLLMFDRRVPIDIVRELRFGPDLQPPVFKTPNALDQQTMRGVRQLTDESAALLDAVLQIAPLSNAQSTARFEVRVDPDVLHLHRIAVRVLKAEKTFYTISLCVPSQPQIQVKIQDAPNTRFQQNCVALPAQDTWTEIFFTLHGVYQSTVALELNAPGLDTQQTDARFRVLPPEAPQVTTPLPSWALALPEEFRAVFVHLEAHESISEAEIIRMLGSPRAFRRFSSEFEELSRKAPFSVRIETSDTGKRYLKERHAWTGS